MSTQDTLPSETPAEAKSGGGVVLQRFVGRHGQTATLYNADCLDVLPLACDVIMTDPPYDIVDGNRGNAMFARSFTRTIRARADAIRGMSTFAPVPFCDAIKRIAWSSAYIFTSKNLLQHYLRFGEEIGARFNVLVWHKTMVAPIAAHNYLPDVEYIIFLHRKGRTWNNNNPLRYYSRVLQSAPCRDKLHPAQKPTDIMAKMIANSTKEGDTVLDPYMGSGSTGMAAVQMKRNFIGIERDAAHYKTACDRIAHELDGALL